MDYEPFPRSLISALTLTDCSMFSLIRDQIKVTTAECVFLLFAAFSVHFNKRKNEGYIWLINSNT